MRVCVCGKFFSKVQQLMKINLFMAFSQRSSCSQAKQISFDYSQLDLVHEFNYSCMLEVLNLTSLGIRG